MPAQTHSRVRNGFHILANSRGRLTNLNGPPCNTAAQCEKAYCCGPAIQPLSSKPRGCRRGLCSFTHNRGRKRALALGGVGSRSAATKRAISRRVENRNKMAPGYVPSATRPRNATEWPTKNATCKTPCPCCLITMTKNHPRNVCLGSCVRTRVPPPPPQSTFFLQLKVGYSNTDSIGLPSEPSVAGAIGYFSNLSYNPSGEIIPLNPTTPNALGTNVLGQYLAARMVIPVCCYAYDNGPFLSRSILLLTARDSNRQHRQLYPRPFTSTITLTNPNTGDSITYSHYADIN